MTRFEKFSIFQVQQKSLKVVLTRERMRIVRDFRVGDSKRDFICELQLDMLAFIIIYMHACMLTGSYRFVLHCMQTRETRIPSEMCARKRVSLMGNTHPQ